MKNSAIAIAFLMGVAGNAFADRGTQNDQWDFWCRIAETGQKIELQLPVDEARRNEAVFSISEPSGDRDVTTLEVRPLSFDYSVKNITKGVHQYHQLQYLWVELGRSGRVDVVAGQPKDPDFPMVTTARLTSTMRELYYPNGIEVDYCRAFYSTGPKPIGSGGN